MNLCEHLITDPRTLTHCFSKRRFLFNQSLDILKYSLSRRFFLVVKCPPGADPLIEIPYRLGQDQRRIICCN